MPSDPFFLCPTLSPAYRVAKTHIVLFTFQVICILQVRYEKYYWWALENPNKAKMFPQPCCPPLTLDQSYLKRDSLDSQISFCFTVFHENSNSSKAERVAAVAPHLFSHIQSLFKPWTKRMQYPILKKQSGKEEGEK